MLQLNNLDKTNKDRKRVGRGGDLGGTSGRGHKGQKARSGASIRPSFEGGQMSLSRRLPKRGFNNPFAKKVTIISLVDLEKKFDAESTVDREALISVGLVKGRKIGTVKILGNTPLTKKLTVIADAFSKGAVQEIEKAGGQVTVLKENERGSDAL